MPLDDRPILDLDAPIPPPEIEPEFGANDIRAFQASAKYTCDGSHAVSLMRQEGPLQVDICLDPHCAHVLARCTHLDAIGRSICEWDTAGQTLTCMFCGVDGT